MNTRIFTVLPLALAIAACGGNSSSKPETTGPHSNSGSANGNSDDKKSEEQKALLDNAFQAGFTAEDVELILIFDNLISSYDEEALNAKRKDSQERFRKM